MLRSKHRQRTANGPTLAPLATGKDWIKLMYMKEYQVNPPSVFFHRGKNREVEESQFYTVAIEKEGSLLL